MTSPIPGITGTLPATPSPSASGAPATAQSKDLGDSNTFLKLLVAQLKYQDPQNPADSTQFLAQTAQFTQVQRLGDILDLLKSERLVTSASMVGHTVTYMDPNGAKLGGVVSGVKLNGDSEPMIHIGNTDVPLSKIMEIQPTGAAPDLSDVTPSAPAGTAPTAPTGLAPVAGTTTPAGTTPVGTTPVGTTPVGTTPAGTTPVGATPIGTTGSNAPLAGLAPTLGGGPMAANEPLPAAAEPIDVTGAGLTGETGTTGSTTGISDLGGDLGTSGTSGTTGELGSAGATGTIGDLGTSGADLDTGSSGVTDTGTTGELGNTTTAPTNASGGTEPFATPSGPTTA